MARTVYVGLDVKEQPYVRGMERAEKATGKVDDAVEDLGGSAKETAAGMGKASESIADAGDSARGTGRALTNLAQDAAHLDRQIDETARGIRDLAREIARTSDAAAKADLTGKLNAKRGDLRGTTDLRKLIDVGDAGVDAATKFGAQFSAQLGPVMARVPMGMGPIGLAVGAAIAVPAAAAVGAAIGGAVVGGIGVGGVVGGLMLAARDSRVKAAAAVVGEEFSSSLDRSAASFVPAALESLGILRSELSSIEPFLTSIFGKSASFVVPLLRAAIAGSKEALSGVLTAVDRAGPVIDVIVDRVPKIGTAFKDALGSISGDARGAAAGVDLVLEGLGGIIRVSGEVVGFFVSLFRAIVNVADAALSVQESLMGWNPLWSGKLDEGRQRIDHLKAVLDGTGESAVGTGAALTGAFGGIQSGAASAAVEVESLADMMVRLRDANMTAERATMQLESAIDAAAAAGKRNNDGISEGTEKGRANREILLGIADAAWASSDAIMATSGSQEEASAATERGRAAFLASAAAMNVGKKEATELATKLFGIPKKVDTKASFKGDDAGVKRWEKTLSGIPRNILIKAEFDLINNSDVAMALRLGRLSTGGPVIGNGPKGVDSKPYLLAPGEHVLSAEEVDRAGGHQVIESMRKGLRDGGTARSMVIAETVVQAGSPPRPVAYAARNPGGSVSVGSAPSVGDTFVYVTIDGQQLEARIDRVVQRNNRDLKRRVQSGATR